MRSIAPGVMQIATAKSSNVFLIEDDTGLTAVDAGTTKTVGALLAALAELGRAPADLTRIVLTHAHPDHIQGAPELRERTGARILIHRADTGWLANGRVPSAGRSGVAARNYDRLSVAHWTPFEPDGALDDDEIVDGAGGLRVIHTPGHSPGHIVLLHEPTRTVLVGDAVFHTGRLGLGPATFAADPTARAAAAARIPTDVGAVGFGHGAPLSGDEVATFRAFLNR